MNPRSDNLPVTILLIEDNPGDVRLTLEAFKDDKITSEIQSLLNGDDAMRFLRKEAEF